MQRRRLVLILFLILPLDVSRLFPAERTRAQAEEVARNVLERAIVIDSHEDTPQMLLDEGYDLADPNSPYMVSIPKMRAGRLGAAFFSIWVETKWPPSDLIHRGLDLIDAVQEQVARHPGELGLASTADDIVRLHEQHKIAILVGVEGGHIIQNDLRALDTFYRLGVRYMTLTHTANNEWADSSSVKPRWNGLNDTGRKVIERMNHLGMMADISHVSDKTFYDTLEVTRAPVIASHSSCRAIVNAKRNMSDDMIRALAKTDGVIQINFYSAFIDQAYNSAQQKIDTQMTAAVEAARRARAKEGQRLTWVEEVRILRKYSASLPTPSFERIADHIDHAAQVGGIDHVGLGSDFDGINSAPRGMEDVSKLPDLVVELARRGYSEEELIKILGGNLLRVMRQVEGVSREMQNPK
jgi:membrane dipeptidase